MSKFRFELNRAGVRALLRSNEMGAVVEGKAAEIAARCGDGYEHDRKLMPTRVIASVYAATPKAASDNFEHNTILRNLQ